ncbi:MAG: primosomal protein N' [Oscillospiraceae bacterium]|nr:primosomal protein N' [Oscillospiraceae bacterium]
MGLKTALCCKVAVAAATYAIDKPYTYLVPDSFQQSIQPGLRVIVPFGRGNRRSEGVILEVREEMPEGRLKWISAILDQQPVVDQEGIRLAIWMRDRCFCTVYDAIKAMLPAGLYYDLQDSYEISAAADPEKLRESIEASSLAERVYTLLQNAGGRMQKRALCEAFGPVDPTKGLKVLLEAGVIRLETSAKRGVGDKNEEIAMLAVSADEAVEAVSKGRSNLRKAVVKLLSEVGSAAAKDIEYFTGAKKKTLRELEEMGLITLFQREVFRRPELDDVARQPAPTLNEEQQTACDGLEGLLFEEKAHCALLYGVTGSGKTAVYINLIHRTLALGKSAMVLVPEIGLTPQLLRQFAAQFGDQVAVLHSSLAAGERYDEWKRAKRGDAKVVIGTRSAVFAPVQNLGLIVLDEEQEASYKSENTPRYHTRDVAKYRCSQNRALLVLGSATPSVESMYFAKSGKYHLYTLTQRYNCHEMPNVLISDTRNELRTGNGSSISTLLRHELEQNLERGEQSILFLNRRGSSRMVICAECGQVPQCDRCSVKLTYHKANGRLMCHYCGHSEPLPECCPECGGPLVFEGVGTQKVEEELQELFPDTPIMRMDADTISAAHTHRQLLRQFEEEKIPILIGTQMVAKGLDFENVTLVGVIDADLTLYVDDFRAGERTFSLITQVVGRAGRGSREGRAVIQTFTPKNEIITAAAHQDYDSFYEQEIALREIRRFPPFEDLFLITVSGPEEGDVLRCTMRLREGLTAWQNSPVMRENPFTVLGPAPAPVLKVNGRYRYRLTVSGENTPAMRAMVAQLLKAAAQDNRNRGLAVYADLNPLD